PRLPVAGHDLRRERPVGGIEGGVRAVTDEAEDKGVTAESVTETETATTETAPSEETAPVAGTSGGSYWRHAAIGLSAVAVVFAILVGWLAYGAAQDSAAETAR